MIQRFQKHLHCINDEDIIDKVIKNLRKKDITSLFIKNFIDVVEKALLNLSNIKKEITVISIMQNYRICSQCKKRKHKRNFYKVHHGKYLMAECKQCFRERAKEDYKKRGIEHNRIIKRTWVEKQGGKAYMLAVSKNYYNNNKDKVNQQMRERYHRTKKRCTVCNKIREKYLFKNNPNICSYCLGLKIKKKY